MLTSLTSDLFAKWYQNNPNALPGLFDNLPELVKLAYYVAFFDEQGIYIQLTSVYFGRSETPEYFWSINEFGTETERRYGGMINRQTAIKSAVTKANEIMNLKLK